MKTEVENKKFVLLKPIVKAPRLEGLLPTPIVVSDEEVSAARKYFEGTAEGFNSPLIWLFEDHDSSDVMAIDIETRGTLPFASSETNYIVGVGFADARGSLYFDLVASGPSLLQYLADMCMRFQVKLIAHNVAFEGPWLLSRTGLWLNYFACTYALYKQTATEGWPGQTWSLKDAMVDVLGWKDTNEKERDEWLVKNGYIRSWSAEYKNGSIWDPNKERYAMPELGEMWRCPPEILGYYCCLDCDSTYLLYMEVLKPVVDKYPHLGTYHHTYFMTLEKELARQQLSGIKIDVENLIKYKDYLTSAISEAEKAFLNFPTVKPFIDMHNEAVLSELSERQPEKYLKKKERVEPSKFKKDGTLSKNWEKWNLLSQEPDVVSKNWDKWNEKYNAAVGVNHFNLNSTQQKCWLFYDKLQFPVLTWTDNETSPSPAIDEDALKGFGEAGKLLINHQTVSKELSFVEGCLDYTKLSNCGTLLHPQFKAPGTLTGRLSGAGGLNFQNMPKTPGYLENWVPREGMTFVDCDWTALEMVVLTALSRDPAMMRLYGPNALAQDVYLYNGAQMAVLGPKIRATGYDPLNPTKESIANAKKLCKRERQIAKTVTLAAAYGAGAAKLIATLGMDGIKITEAEGQAIHSSYWELYSGVVKYRKWLERFWEASGGWVPNLLGRPIAVDAGYRKDILNRVIQSSGHDLHVAYVHFLSLELENLEREGIEVNRIIIDFHDQSILECNTEHSQRVKELMGTIVPKIVNSILGCDIQFKMDPQIISTMAEAKCEKEVIEQWLIKKANLLSQ